MNKQLICSSTRVIQVKETVIPEAPADGLILKVHYAGVCHTDVHVYSEKEHSIVLPKILGHEISGTVYALGENCRNDRFQIDDQVVVYSCSGCRKCVNCRAPDNSHNCLDRVGKHVHNYGIWKDGGFQNYMMVEDPWSVVKIPAGIPLHLACLVPCSGVTAYNAVEQCALSITRAIKIKGHASMLILGTGGVGKWAVEIAKTMYGDKIEIIAADISENKLEEAKSVGADYCCLIQKDADVKDLASQVNNYIAGGVDAAIDFVTNTVSFERVFWCLGTSSTYIMVGVSAQPLPPINLLKFIMKNITLQGIYCGSKEQINKVFTMIAGGKIKGPDIKYITLEEVGNVLDEMLKGSLNAGRTVVDMNDSYV